MPRDKVALLINSCAKKPKPRRVTPSAPRPAQRSEHIDDALMATKRRRVAFGDVSIHVFPMAIADNPAVRSGVALGLGREEVCCIVKSVDEHQPLRPRFYPRRPVPWIHPERRREILAAEGISPEAIEASRKLVRAAQLERIKSLPPLDQRPPRGRATRRSVYIYSCLGVEVVENRDKGYMSGVASTSTRVRQQQETVCSAGGGGAGDSESLARRAGGSPRHPAAPQRPLR